MVGMAYDEMMEELACLAKEFADVEDMEATALNTPRRAWVIEMTYIASSGGDTRVILCDGSEVDLFIKQYREVHGG